MENNVIRTGVKNTAYVIIAQSISLLFGIVRTLIVPMLLFPTSFGYWQVYLLYMAYVGIFALGFNDGIYLKYGKYNYNELPKKTFRSSIRVFIMFQLLTVLIVLAFTMFESDASKQVAMIWVSINIPIAGLTGLLMYILQITNQLKKYSFYTILNKALVLILIVGLFLFKIDNFVIIIIVDTLARLFVLALMINYCKEIIFGKRTGYKVAFKEVSDNVRVGIKLMLANFAGMLVLGFGRILVERTATVEEYGAYSFAISTTSLVLVLITAIGLVIYPTMSRIEKDKYANYFTKLNKILVVIVFAALIVLFPLKIFISSFLPYYTNIFNYLSVIFAIIFVQSKMQILINPYYKLLRKESMMLKANIIGVLGAIILILPLYFLTNSVLMVAIGTLLAMLIRLYFSEIYLKKVQNIIGNKNIIYEIIIMLLFVFLGIMSNFYLGFVGYFIVVFIFAIRHFNDIKEFAKYILKKDL